MSIDQKQIRLSHTLCFLFSGKAGTGKSFSSNISMMILNELKLNTYKSPFASSVKDTAKFMGWDGNKDEAGRKLLQDIGRAGRNYDPCIWAKSAFGNIEENSRYPFDAVFIDDWRYKNEYEYIVNNQFLYKPITIRINAPDREILLGTPEYYDSSETELDNYSFDYVIDNPNGSASYMSNITDMLTESISRYKIG